MSCGQPVRWRWVKGNEGATDKGGDEDVADVDNDYKGDDYDDFR